MAPRTFKATAEREGRWWVFELPELGTGGQAASLAEVEHEAQGVAAMWLNVDPKKVRVVVTVTGQDEALAEWAAAERAEQDARIAVAAAAEQRKAVVDKLRRLGWSAPDLGRLLGISKQRVYQITVLKTRSGAVVTQTKTQRDGRVSVSETKNGGRITGTKTAAHVSPHPGATRISKNA